MRTLSTTKNDLDDNHREKLCKVSRVSGDIPVAKSDCFRSEFSKFNSMLNRYANVFVLKTVNWA